MHSSRGVGPAECQETLTEAKLSSGVHPPHKSHHAEQAEQNDQDDRDSDRPHEKMGKLVDTGLHVDPLSESSVSNPDIWSMSSKGSSLGSTGADKDPPNPRGDTTTLNSVSLAFIIKPLPINAGASETITTETFSSGLTRRESTP